MMKRKNGSRVLAVLLVAALCFGIVGCGNNENKARAPFGDTDFKGMQYEDALLAIHQAGFINVTENAINGILGKEGSVQNISINGENVFSKGKVYENSVPVVITYYAVKSEEPISQEPAEIQENKEPVKRELLEVTFEVEVTGEEGKPVFIIETNLPDDTEMGLYLFGDNLYYDEQFVTVKDGKVESGPFTNDGAALTGYSVLGITMLPTDQPESVQAVVGAKGEYLTGPAVIVLDTYSYVATEIDFSTSENGNADALSEADMKILIEYALAQGFGDDYELSQDGVIYTVNVWQDGLAMLALLAKGGNAEAMFTWQQIRETTVTASKTIQKLLDENGQKDHLAVINVVNDANHDNILLCVMAGTVVSDCTV